MTGRRQIQPVVAGTIVGLSIIATTIASIFFTWLARGGVTPPEADVSPRRTLVVLYANESTAHALESEQYQVVLRILETSNGDLAKGLRAELIADAREFPAAIARNHAALLAQARRAPFDLALFTNDLAYSGRYLLNRNGQQDHETLLLTDVPSLDHPFLATAPLSDPRLMRTALLDLIGRYPTEPLDVVLLTFSHGTLDMALMPRVNIDLRSASENEIRRAVEQSADAPASPDWARSQGTSKAEFWRVLGALGAAHPQLHFPLVVRGSCQSALMSLDEYLAIPPIVGLIGHTGLESPTIRSVRLDKVLDDRHAPFSPAVLAEGARSASYRVDSRRSIALWLVPVLLWQIPLAVYCMPVALWLVWMGWSSARSRLAADRLGAKSPIR